MSVLNVGVLALQGAFREHTEAFESLGASVCLVKSPRDLASVDAIVLPGGESTTQTKLLDSAELRHPLQAYLADGMACFATCAGLILLAREVRNGRPDQVPLGALDIVVQRNGYGRQVDSFEADLDLTNLKHGSVGEDTFRGVFIRAPKITAVGDADVLIMHDDSPVLVRHGAIWGTTFHPELAHDLRIHRAFLQQCAA